MAGAEEEAQDAPGKFGRSRFLFCGFVKELQSGQGFPSFPGGDHGVASIDQGVSDGAREILVVVHDEHRRFRTPERRWNERHLLYLGYL